MDDYSSKLVDEEITGCCPNSKFCNKYSHALRTKPIQKKPININHDELLSTRLKRCLTSTDLTAYGIASMIGGTIFVLTGTVARTKTGPSTFIAYILAGIVAIMNATMYSELACRFPKAGSVYTYSYVMLGEWSAFLAGWAVCLEYILGLSSVARGWSSNLNMMLGGRLEAWTEVNIGQFGSDAGFFAKYLDFVACALVLIVAISTCFGIQNSSWLNIFFTIFNVGALISVTIFMFNYAVLDNIVKALPSNVTIISSFKLTHGNSIIPYGIGGLIAATATCFNAFIGFDMISTCAEEAQEPSKSIPRSNFIAITVVTVLLGCSCLALTLYVPWFTFDNGAPFLKALLDNTAGGTMLARNIMFYIVAIGCLVGLFSNLLTSAIAAPRIVYAMAEDGLIFSSFAYISKTFKTPVISTAMIAILGAILALIFAIDSLADFLSLGTLLAYSQAAIAVVLLRFRPPPETIINLPDPKLSSTSELESNASTVDTIHQKDKEFERLELSAEVERLIDRPGYLKATWAKRLPKKFVIFMIADRSPGQMVCVFISIFMLCVVGLLLSVLIWPVYGDMYEAIWRLIVSIFWLLGMFLSVCIISMHRQFKPLRSELFQPPLVPLLPCLTVLFNFVLISELSWMTWVRFTIWTIIGSCIYFTFGVMHSNVGGKLGEKTSLLVKS